MSENVKKYQKTLNVNVCLIIEIISKTSFIFV